MQKKEKNIDKYPGGFLFYSPGTIEFFKDWYSL
jgi:hypothetical protein